MPSGWRWVRLGDICEILDYKRIPIKKSDRTAGPYPYYGATGILDYVDDYIFDESLVLIGEDGAKWESGEKTAFVAVGKYWVNNHAHVIRLYIANLLNDFLVSWLTILDLTPYISGLTVPKLNQEKLRVISIPLPPLAEQKRIVAALNKKMAAVEQARAAALERVEAVRALPAAFLREVFCFGDGELPSGWRWVRLGDVCEVQRGSSITKKEITRGDIPVIAGGQQPAYYHNQSNRAGRVITVSGSGAYAGFVNFFDHPIFASDCSTLQVKIEDVQVEYIYSAMKWRQPDIYALRLGAAQPHVYAKDVSGIKIPLPPLAEQKQIVAALNQKIAAAETARVAAESELKAIKALPAAFLRQAFSGAL